MTFYATPPTASNKMPTVHRTRDCSYVKRPEALVPVRAETAKTRKRCRYCFPEEEPANG